MDPNLPDHVAIIMDGNGRWARRRQLPRTAGHRAGVENLRDIIKHCVDTGISALTLFAFSSENWRRPIAEIELLFELFVLVLEQEIERLHEAGVRFRVVGDRNALPKELGQSIAEAEYKTQSNERFNLVIAANYGGRWDITEATRKIGLAVERGELQPDSITADMISENLVLCDLPEPDLFIRPGGEKRISNYLLWQLAYTELYFTDCLWPDFDVLAFQRALTSYGGRQRRYGMTGDQLDVSTDPLITSEAK